MLQLDNMSSTHSTRTKCPPDFLARNRKAIKDLKPKSGVEKKPPNKTNKTPHQHTHRSQVDQQQKFSSKDGVRDDTVVISKSYLDNLLRMNLIEKKEGPTHVDLSPSQIPGLQTSHHHHHGDHDQPNKQRKTISPNEDYFPFGRPGCGAPLRTESGQVMADLRYAGTYSNYNTPSKSHSLQHNSLPTHTSSPTHHHHGYHDPPKTSPNEDYFPFGRPGCGAPLRTESGQVMADLRYADDLKMRHSHLLPPNVPERADDKSQVSTNHLNTELASSRFARGAGPHVDNYALKEKAEKRRKHLEHVAYLKVQMEAKELAKKEEKEQRKREERAIEEQVQRERERLQDEYQIEKEKSQRREEEVRYRQTILQQAIDLAAMNAKENKNKILHRSHRSPPPLASSTFSPAHARGHHPNVTFDLRKKGKNTFPPSSPPSYRSQQRSTTVISRIPVRNKPEISHHSKGRGNQNRETRRDIRATTTTTTTTTTSSSSSKGARANTTIGRGLGRVSSPPVPALAKTIARLNDNLHLPPLTNEGSSPPGQVPPVPAPAPPSRSPPVPALAHKMKKIEATSPHSYSNKGIPSSRPIQPLPENATPTSHLPPSNGVPHPPQKGGLLQELAELRKGILSHRSTIDDKLISILHHNNQKK